MKEVLNIRIDKEILNQIKNFQLLIGKQSGFVPSRTAVIERMIVLGLEQETDAYSVYTNTSLDSTEEDQLEIQSLGNEIFSFTQVWLDNDAAHLEE